METVLTDEEGSLGAADDVLREFDPEVRAMAIRIARRMARAQPAATEIGQRRSGEVQSVPFRDSADDIDIDRTLESMVDKPSHEAVEIVVRDRMRADRTTVLLVDLSGSMGGERVRTTAATVGALAGRLAHDDVAVLAFWSDAAWVARFGQIRRPGQLIDSLLRLPTAGLTNLAFPLALAGTALRRSRAGTGRVVLLSDCVHNAGPDPRLAAARLPRLDVLLDVTGERDVELGQELAALAGGRMHRIRNHRDVAPALTAMFRQ